ncbi:MAG: hypothetical protein ACHQUB_01895 [Candidatus Saccharimonadia bacterium]
MQKIAPRKQFRIYAIGVFVCVIMSWGLRLYLISKTGLPGVTGANQIISDEVSMQNIIWDVTHGLRGVLQLPSDNWSIKYTLYWLIIPSHLAPFAKLYLESALILTLTCALLLYSIAQAMNYFNFSVREKKLGVIVIGLYLAMLPQTLFYILKVPNSRNIEIGLAALLVVLTLRILKFGQERGLIYYMFYFVIATLLWFDDPLFIVNLAVPLGLITLYMTIFQPKLRDRAIPLLAAIVGSLALSQAFVLATERYWQVHFSSQSIGLANYTLILANLRRLASSGTNIFGLHQPLGQGLLLSLALNTIYLIIFGFIIWGLFNLSKIDRIAGAILVILGLFSFASFIFGRSLPPYPDQLESRYLIMLLPISLFGLLGALKSKYKHREKVLIVLLGIGVVGLIISSLVSLPIATSTPVNPETTAIIKELAQLGVTKGYGNYQSSALISYFSAHEVNAVSLSCNQANGQVTLYKHINNSAEVDVPARTSFYITSASSYPDCALARTAGQFGPPTKVITLPHYALQIAIYPYDIGERIH